MLGLCLFFVVLWVLLSDILWCGCCSAVLMLSCCWCFCPAVGVAVLLLIRTVDVGVLLLMRTVDVVIPLLMYYGGCCYPTAC